MTAQTFDPKDVTVTVDGKIITGFAEEMVSAERENPQVDDLSGAQGDVARVITNDKRGIITISLLPTSPSNLILSDLMNLDGVNQANVIFPLVIKDNRGSDLISAEDAWITQPPRTVYNKSIETREWTIRAAKLDMVIAGIQPVA